jgi:hypothetical protein
LTSSATEVSISVARSVVTPSSTISPSAESSAKYGVSLPSRRSGSSVVHMAGEPSQPLLRANESTWFSDAPPVSAKSSCRSSPYFALRRRVSGMAELTHGGQWYDQNSISTGLAAQVLKPLEAVAVVDRALEGVRRAGLRRGRARLSEHEGAEADHAGGGEERDAKVHGRKDGNSRGGARGGHPPSPILSHLRTPEKGAPRVLGAALHGIPLLGRGRASDRVRGA